MTQLESKSAESNFHEKEYIEDGIIDELYYAGEMTLSTDENGKKEIDINLLSGTFMDGIIDAHAVSDNDVNNIKNVLLNNLIDIDPPLEVGNIKVNMTGNTFVTNEMTIENLLDYVQSGLQVYKFNLQEDANKFSNSALLLMKLDAQKALQERNRKRFGEIDDINQKINDIGNRIQSLNEFIEQQKTIDMGTS